MLEAAAQQLRGEVLNADAARKHRHHGLHDRHFHAVAASQLGHHGSRLNRLGRLTHVLVQTVGGNPLGQQAAGRVVTGQW